MDRTSVVNDLGRELGNAMAAIKCHRCGCFQDAVNSFDGSTALKQLLPGVLDEARRLFAPKRYDCLGCEVCWPALAANAAAEIDPLLVGASHCATAEPEVREGWPPLPGDYQALRFQAPVAVCALNSDELPSRLAAARPPGLAIVGSLHTENLGIEHLVRNLLPNPNVRFLIVCGEDTRQAVGHLPGQSLVSLMQEGLDEQGRIRKALGKRPLIRNIGSEEIELFRRRVQVVDLIGITDIEVIAEHIARAAANDPGPDEERAAMPFFPVEQALEPTRLVPDPAGYLVIYPERRRRLLVLEHYSNDGLLTRIIEGASPAALYAAAIAQGLVSRLDHAAYLGRELARAEAALHSGDAYVQDRAAGEEDAVPSAKGCGCGSACGSE